VSTPENYQQQLIQLQPRGRALPAELDSTWGRLLKGIGVEFSRIHGRMDTLVAEVLLKETSELLDDWETSVGLPGKCAPAAVSDAARLERIIGKLAEIGGSTPEYFIGIAARYGITIVLDEDESPFEMGVHGMGDPVGGDEWRYVWYAHVDPAPPLAVRQLIECVFQSIAPGDRLLKWRWGDEPVCPAPFLYDGSYNYDGSTQYGPATCGVNVLGFDGTHNYDGSAVYGV